MASARDWVEHHFNNDLLVNEGDVARAANLYGEIIHAVHHPELIERFKLFDGVAQKAKRSRHRQGYAAVLLGSLSLVLAAILLVFGVGKPIFDVHEHADPAFEGGLQGLLAMVLRVEPGTISVSLGTLEGVVALVAAFAGVASIVFALGIFGRSRKEHWLCTRLMAERLRQFHFQIFVFHFREIVASARPGGDKAQFAKDRSRWLAQFDERFSDKLQAELSEAIEGSPSDDFALFPEPESFEDVKLDAADPIVKTTLEAYDHLRIQHQLQFATLKLGDQSGLWPSLPRPLSRRIAFLSFFCIGLLLVSDIVAAGRVASEGVDAYQRALTVRNKLRASHSDAGGAKPSDAASAKPATQEGAKAADAGAGRPSEAGGTKPAGEKPDPGSVSGTDTEVKGGSWYLPSLLHLGALCLAITVLALRALEEGLKPDREAERYLKYRSAVLRARDRFHAARTLPAKLEVMMGMERLAYDEMCDFLRTHAEARFVM